MTLSMEAIGAIAKDGEWMRVELYKKHCLDQRNAEMAVLCLATEFLSQAVTVLEVLYGQDRKLVHQHLAGMVENYRKKAI